MNKLMLILFFLLFYSCESPYVNAYFSNGSSDSIKLKIYFDTNHLKQYLRHSEWSSVINRDLVGDSSSVYRQLNDTIGWSNTFFIKPKSSFLLKHGMQDRFDLFRTKLVIFKGLDSIVVSGREEINSLFEQYDDEYKYNYKYVFK